MKSIQVILMLAITASVFFTGCSNSLVGNMNVEAENVGSSMAMEMDATRASEDGSGENTGGSRLNYTDEDRNQEMPNFFEQMLAEKENITGGTRAFRIMDGHSEKVSDFQIGELLKNRTFIYGYITTLKDNPNKKVHCAAFYNYESGDFKVFHEKYYDSEEVSDENETFYLQVCTRTSGDVEEIFIYDNGHGYIYNTDGSLKIHMDLETYVRQQYPNVYSLMITKAITDGNNRIYMEIFIEKEDMSALVKPDSGDEEKSDKEIEREAEYLDQQMAEKTDEIILVYEFKEISSDMIQENTAFNNQKNAWISMTEGKEYTEEPDAEEDWKSVIEKTPNVWSGVKLTSYNNLPMYQWKDEERFLYESSDGPCTFTPYPETYIHFTDLKKDTELSRVFYAPDNHYSRIYGRIGEIKEEEEETITRTYTYVWEETVEDEEGKSTTTKYSKEREQSIKKTKNRRAPLQQAYTESFWNLKGVRTLGNSLDSSIIGINEDGKVQWIRSGGKLEDADVKLSEDCSVEVFHNGSEVCLVASDIDSLYLFSDELYQVDYKNLPGIYESGISVADKMPEGTKEEDLDDSDFYSTSEHYTEKNILRLNLDLDDDLLRQLREKDPEGDWPERGGTWNGFLFTSRNTGLTYYDPKREDGILLSDGYWFQSFFINGKVVSVGFADEKGFYTIQDMGKARVFEYDLDELCEAQMKRTIEEILAKEEAQRIAESEAAAAAETATKYEGVKNPMEQWNEKYQKTN